MPTSDYTGAVGGALKFKGGSKITKARKKVRPKPEQADSSTACDTSAFDVTTEPDGDEPTDAPTTATTTATPEKPPTTRRTSSQNDSESTPRRRSTLSVPASSADAPRERLTSPAAPASAGEWHATPPRRAETARDDEAALAGALRGAGWRAATEAERRAEERRRRRIEDRVRREGAKTHKERVEEFNARLAALSEHHDMPRIGPG